VDTGYLDMGMGRGGLYIQVVLGHKFQSWVVGGLGPFLPVT